jgi:hypothetical protein
MPFSLFAQTDTLNEIRKQANKYISQVNRKAVIYKERIGGRIEKTLGRLARWEQKIGEQLQNRHPEIFEQLFGNGRLTFATLLENYGNKSKKLDGYSSRFDDYRDKVNGTVLYLKERDKLMGENAKKRLSVTNEHLTDLDTAVQDSESLTQIIKERRRQLVEVAYKYIGQRKYFNKINKEAFYYTEAMGNYRELFSDKKKQEETLLALVQKIPGYQTFIEANSQLASLFGLPMGYRGSTQISGGLQTRSGVNALIRTQMAAGGSNAMQMVQQNMQQAQAALTNLKSKLNKMGGQSSDVEMPDFVPNQQRTKSFWQRIEIKTDLQANRGSRFLPNTADLAAGLAFKIDDKKQIGSQLVYKAGLGNGLHNIKLTHQGIGYRFYTDLKLKGSFWLTAGYENHYFSTFKNFRELETVNNWQTSALAGLSKKWKLKKKGGSARLLAGGEMKILYDFLWNKKPGGQRIVWRTGISF